MIDYIKDNGMKNLHKDSVAYSPITVIAIINLVIFIAINLTVDSNQEVFGIPNIFLATPIVTIGICLSLAHLLNKKLKRYWILVFGIIVFYLLFLLPSVWW